MRKCIGFGILIYLLLKVILWCGYKNSKESDYIIDFGIDTTLKPQYYVLPYHDPPNKLKPDEKDLNNEVIGN